MQQEAGLQSRTPAWASEHRPSETCFPFACSKVCIHSHERHQGFDNNMTQLIRTRLQNVCLWGPANSAMCLCGEAIEEPCTGSLGLAGLGWGGVGDLYVHKDVHQMAHRGLNYFHYNHCQISTFTSNAEKWSRTLSLSLSEGRGWGEVGGVTDARSFCTNKVVQFRGRTCALLAPLPTQAYSPAPGLSDFSFRN